MKRCFIWSTFSGKVDRHLQQAFINSSSTLIIQTRKTRLCHSALSSISMTKSAVVFVTF